MTNDQSNILVLRRPGATRTILGRGFGQLYFQLRRWRAVWFFSGTSVLKRGLDVIASFVLLGLLSPLFLLIGLLVKLEDGGPLFFSQRRVGQFGREFRMFKIRSMCL